MAILRGAKTLMLWVELLSYKIKPWELWTFILETLILKSEDQMIIENILFINKSLNNLLSPIFKDWFTFCSDVHSYQTVSSSSNKIIKPSDPFGKKSVTKSRNKTQYQFRNLSLKTYSPSKTKSLLSKKCIENY